jgi:microcystin-dependent protein
MPTPYLGELKVISWNYAPPGWAFCNGQFLPINQNQALFSLLGTTYGGNGQTTFALPDLRGRTPLHVGQGLILGQKGGEEAHTVTQSEMPQHLHRANATTNAATLDSPANNVLAELNVNAYGPANSLVAMNPGIVTNTGGSQPHENRQPYAVLNVIIALQGVFPSRN